MQQSGVTKHAGQDRVCLIRHTVQPFTESDDTTCCYNTICPPKDGRVDARNILSKQ